MRARTDLWEPSASNRPGHLAVGHFKPTRLADLYQAISKLSQEDFEVTHLCESLEVSRSAFYDWKNTPPNLYQKKASFFSQ